jgi:hypothetical protein
MLATKISKAKDTIDFILRPPNLSLI